MPIAIIADVYSLHNQITEKSTGNPNKTKHHGKEKENTKKQKKERSKEIRTKTKKEKEAGKKIGKTTPKKQRKQEVTAYELASPSPTMQIELHESAQHKYASKIQ